MSPARKTPKPPSRPEHIEQAEFIAWCEAMAGRHPELRDVYAIPNAGG